MTGDASGPIRPSEPIGPSGPSGPREPAGPGTPDGHAARIAGSPVRRGPVVRSAASLVVSSVVVGVIGGLVWRFASPAAHFQVTSPGEAQMAEPELMRVFFSDGTFLIAGIVGGALLAAVLSWVGRAFPWLWNVVVLLAACAAAAVAWGIGLIVARPDTNRELSEAKPGALIAQPLGLHAHVVLAGWVLGAALVLVVVAVVRWYVAPDRPAGAGRPDPSGDPATPTGAPMTGAPIAPGIGPVEGPVGGPNQRAGEGSQNRVVDVGTEPQPTASDRMSGQPDPSRDRNGHGPHPL